MKCVNKRWKIYDGDGEMRRTIGKANSGKA